MSIIRNWGINLSPYTGKKQAVGWRVRQDFLTRS